MSVIANIIGYAVLTIGGFMFACFVLCGICVAVQEVLFAVEEWMRK